jgi:hypothetical protein
MLQKPTPKLVLASVMMASPWLSACGGEDQAVGLDVGDDGEASCDVELRANLVFYENTCFSSWIECDEEYVAPTEEVGARFCDVMGITCTEPDRSESVAISYTTQSSSCRFCSDGSVGEPGGGPSGTGEVRCTAIPPGCGTQVIEHLASGSPETGTRPMADTCDEQ